MLILLSELAQGPVAFRETFWAVTGTAAPVIALAAVLSSVDLARLHPYATTPDWTAWLRRRYTSVGKLKPVAVRALAAKCSPPAPGCASTDCRIGVGRRLTASRRFVT